MFTCTMHYVNKHVQSSNLHVKGVSCIVHNTKSTLRKWGRTLNRGYIAKWAIFRFTWCGSSTPCTKCMRCQHSWVTTNHEEARQGIMTAAKRLTVGKVVDLEDTSCRKVVDSEAYRGQLLPLFLGRTYLLLWRYHPSSTHTVSSLAS